jgi:HD-like signal output (HDOD) protein
MRMPVLDGLTLLEQVQQQRPEAIRIILSGNAEESDVLRAVGPAHQYLTKPCDPDRLRTTVIRAREIYRSAGDVGIEAFGNLRNFPVFPQVYEDIRDVLNSDEVSMQRVAEVIGRDPGFTVRVLKLVNSAWFGLSRTIGDISEAVPLLGIESINSLCLGDHAVCQLASEGPSAKFGSRVWSHCQRCASLARRIAQESGCDRGTVDAAFFAGLMHDVGMLVISDQDGETYERLINAVERYQVPLVEAEEKVLRRNHAQGAACLLGLWGIPDRVLEAVLFHHSPDRCHPERMDATVAVHIADCLDAEWNPIGLMVDATLDEELMQRLGLPATIEEWDYLRSEATS